MSSVLPKLAIIGRPNVGKSSLFNFICRRRVSIIDEAEGITRDRIHKVAVFNGKPFVLIDTGGIDAYGTSPFQQAISEQALTALKEADSVIMLVDGTSGITVLDADLAKIILKNNKQVVLAVNKLDKLRDDALVGEFYKLGISKVIGISVMQERRIESLLREATKDFSQQDAPKVQRRGVKLSIVGRPNVGKSTIINSLVNEERCIVHPTAGTTRDSIEIPFTFNGKEFVFIDTAGIRRRKTEKELVDTFSFMRTESTIKRSDVCCFVIDAVEGITSQEKKILHQIDKESKPALIVVNKWDLIEGFRMEHCRAALRALHPVLAFAPILFVSGKEKRNVHLIPEEATKLFDLANTRIKTHELNKFIESTIEKLPPPVINGKRLKVYYATQPSTNPPEFVLFINHENRLNQNYKKFLQNSLRNHFGLHGVPIIVKATGKPKEPKK